MKLAIIGSRNLTDFDLSSYLSSDVTEIITGGAKGIDRCAKDFATAHHIKLTEFLPEYQRYGRAAPIYRNQRIVNDSDRVLAIWDGRSRGTKSVIEYCKRVEKPLTVILLSIDNKEDAEETGIE